jgi:endonuclease III
MVTKKNFLILSDIMETEKEMKVRAKKILSKLEKNYPSIPNLFLNYKTDAQMICAIILSAQSTDAQINKLTKKLFKKYFSVKDFANANKREFEKEIFSSGFYKNKAKNILSTFKILQKNYGGRIPLNMQSLLELPGIGRKTANLILLNKGIISGIAVDTHVLRLSNRLGFIQSKNQLKVETKLTQLYPKNKWAEVNKLFISHGRATCTAKSPFCNKCFLFSLCPRVNV